MRWESLGAACAAIVCMAPSVGYAAPEDALQTNKDAFQFVTGAAVRYDDNLFRLAEDRPVPIAGKSQRSEMIYEVNAGVRFDKTYSLQRFQVDLTATRNEYQNYSALSFTGLNYRAAWLWSITPRLTGTISADRTKSQGSYADFTNNTTRNTQIVENQQFMADWWVSGGWHLTGGVSRQYSDNSAPSSAIGNYTQNTAEAGVRYVSAAENSIALVQRQSQGEYDGHTLGPALLDTRYDQRETELRTIWRASAHSTLDARLAYRDRTHEHYSQRDYSGTVGSLSYLWTPTGKLQFTLAAGRDLGSYQETTNQYSSSYYASDYVSLAPAWLITDKTTLRFKYDLSKRDYRGAVVARPDSREDTMRVAQLSLAWRPTASINVDSYVTRETRSSNIDGADYHDKIIGISAGLRF